MDNRSNKSPLTDWRLPNSGWVYVLTNPAMPGLVKIGRTQKGDMAPRLRELSSATGVPEKFSEYGSEYALDCKAVEAAVHACLQYCRTNQKREFFRISPELALDVVRKLVETDNHSAENERSAFDFVARSGNVHLISCAADSGFDFKNATSALRISMEAGDEPMAVALIERGVDLDSNWGDGSAGHLRTFYEAAVFWRLSAVQRAMEARSVKATAAALVQSLGDDDATEAQWSAFDYCLSAGVANQPIAHLRRITPLMHICERTPSRSKTRVIELLLSAGADVNWGGDCGWLMGSVVETDDAEVAALFLDRGADPNCDVPARAGDYPLLSFALINRKPGIAAMLLAAGADPNRIGDKGQTPLMIATGVWAHDRHPTMLAMIKKLREANAVAWLSDTTGNTAMSYLLFAATEERDAKTEAMLLADEGCRAVLCDLIRGGCDPLADDPDAEVSPLFVFCDHRQLELVETCLEQGIDLLRASPRSGNTVVHHLTSVPDSAALVASVLDACARRSSGYLQAVLRAKNADGRTALHLAALRGRWDIYDQLYHVCENVELFLHGRDAVGERLRDVLAKAGRARLDHSMTQHRACA